MLAREQYTRRYYLPEDYPALVELVKASNAALGHTTHITAEELAAIVEVPEFNRQTDSIIFGDGGRIIAMSNQGFSAESGRCWGDSVVHPDYWGQGIGAQLIRLTEARCMEWAESALAPDHPILLQFAAAEQNARALRLFEAHGYHVVRVFNQMHITFDQPMTAPPLPGKLVLHPFDAERDAEAVYETHMEAFANHWGFERDRYEDWLQQTLYHPSNDISLWLIAYDGDEIVGICINRAGEGDDPDMAWVWALGVLPAWRRQGLGEALLRMSFARFQERGFKRAGLMVDSSNATNALALYKRAGMHVYRSKGVYHKMLRGTAFPEG
jgi:mycothiol synthase